MMLDIIEVRFRLCPDFTYFTHPILIVEDHGIRGDKIEALPPRAYSTGTSSSLILEGF